MTEVRLDPLREAVARRLLTLVLLTVLVWYTVVVPVPGAAFVRSAGGGRDAEEREGGGPRAAVGGENARAEDLDWPEFIDG